MSCKGCARSRVRDNPQARAQCAAVGAVVQAYRPLAHGVGSLLADPTVKRIGRLHGRGSAEVALRWLLQQGHALVTSTEDPAHMSADLDAFKWTLDEMEMRALTELSTSPDDPVSTMCKV